MPSAEPIRSAQIKVTDPDAGLKITEVFTSLQGESSSFGQLTTFIRLTGCPLRCSYCDTEYAFVGGSRMSLTSLVSAAQDAGAPFVCVTGGEPLAQPNALPLLTQLCDHGFKVSLETSGALPIDSVDPRVTVVLDLKTPSSNEAHQNLWGNLNALLPHHEVKFVIGSEADYRWALDTVITHNLHTLCAHVWFSPVFDPQGKATSFATTLANLMVKDKPPARLALQLHKILWNDAPGH